MKVNLVSDTAKQHLTTRRERRDLAKQKNLPRNIKLWLAGMTAGTFAWILAWASANVDSIIAKFAMGVCFWICLHLYRGFENKRSEL
jgi:hypothetical protein